MAESLVYQGLDMFPLHNSLNGTKWEHRELIKIFPPANNLFSLRNTGVGTAKPCRGKDLSGLFPLFHSSHLHEHI